MVYVEEQSARLPADARQREAHRHAGPKIERAYPAFQRLAKPGVPGEFDLFDYRGSGGQNLHRRLAAIRGPDKTGAQDLVSRDQGVDGGPQPAHVDVFRQFQSAGQVVGGAHIGRLLRAQDG